MISYVEMPYHMKPLDMVGMALTLESDIPVFASCPFNLLKTKFIPQSLFFDPCKISKISILSWNSFTFTLLRCSIKMFEYTN